MHKPFAQMYVRMSSDILSRDTVSAWTYNAGNAYLIIACLLCGFSTLDFADEWSRADTFP